MSRFWVFCEAERHLAQIRKTLRAAGTVWSVGDVEEERS